MKALKKSAKAAEHDELRQAFETHAEESAQQVERLTQVFEIIGKPARAKTCEAMQGIVSEMEEDLEDFEDSPAADAVLAACAQAVEHYEIARYGTLKTWAAQLGYAEAAQLLDETLQEEKKTDALLSKIAESINTAGTPRMPSRRRARARRPPERADRRRHGGAGSSVRDVRTSARRRVSGPNSTGRHAAQ